MLIRDPLKIVAVATIKSPGVTDSEAARYAANASLPEEVIRYISQKREWTKMYGVKVSLCRNPKTPIPESTKLLPFLREKDLTNISKSRGVPSAVVSAGAKADHAAARRGKKIEPRGPDKSGPGFLARIGLAIVAPKWALAIAADRRNAGRSGTDLLSFIALVILATQLRGLVGAGWLASAVDVGLGLRGAIQVLTRALTVELGFLVVAAIVLFAAGGPRRNLGRAFDLACVAALPLFFVALIATVVVRTIDLVVGHFDLPGGASFALAVVSYTWAGALIALAVRPARKGAVVTSDAAIPKPRATRAGAAALVLVLAGAIVQVVWLAGHMESMRPMTDGDPAPEFALPLIAKGGGQGAQVTLAQYRGKVVVVDFWATWCGPCIRAMPKLESLARRYTGELEVIAVNLDDAAKARTMFDEGGYRITLVSDDGEVSARYGVSTIPHSVVIDREGIVRMVYRGGSSKLTSDVEAIISEKIRK